MKKFIITVAMAAGITGVSLFGGSEAKADYRTLHGVADIIEATGSLVGRDTTVYYDPYPVYYEPVYYYRPAPRRVYYDHHYYRPRHHRSYYHCY